MLDGTPLPEKPIVVVSRTGSKRQVSAADEVARKLGIRVGMPAAKAQALVADLAFYDADAKGDLEGLDRLALWMLRQYSPVVATDGTDGLVLDTEGADHLQGGESLMLSGIVNRLRGVGVTARAALADTWGAAHALARATTAETTIVPVGGTRHAVLGLPIFSLRLSSETVNSLRVLGIDTVGQLAAMPRAPLTLRYGPEPGRRYVGKLVVQLCSKLEANGLGVRRADLLVHRVDNVRQVIRAGMAKAVRDDRRLTRLFCDRIEKIEPGWGIERLTLVAAMAEPLEPKQTVSSLIEESVTDITPLVDILGNRGLAIYRFTPVASDVPERSFKRVPPMSYESGTDWP